MARPDPRSLPAFIEAPSPPAPLALARAASRPGVPDAAPCALKRILLVDDEAHVLRVMRLSLDRNGYEVDTALDAEVALRMLREHRHAALIVGGELAPRGRGLCESVARLYGAAAPLMLVMDEEGSDGQAWSPSALGVERVERPVSLRWIVARLNEYFGDYERRRA